MGNKYQQSITYAQDIADYKKFNANTYTHYRFNQFCESANRQFQPPNDRISEAEDKLNAGIADVTAIASILYIAEDTFSYGIGLGNYENRNAIAAGVQYKTTLNTNVTGLFP